eukprot:11618_1
MLIVWLVVTIELIFGENILKGDGLSHVLDSTFDQINDISYLDFSDLSMIKKATSLLTQNITQQQFNVTLALSHTEISNDDKNKILGFYDILQERMSILSSLSTRTYDFYSKQMAENDDFISKTEEMILILNDMDIHDYVDELTDIIDIIIIFKNSASRTRHQLFVLIDDYTKFTKETQSYMKEQGIQIPKGFLDKYKKDDHEFVEQNIMIFTIIITVVTASSNPLWPWFLLAELGLSLKYIPSNLELIQTYDIYDEIDDNIQNSFSTLDQCIKCMITANETLTDIDNRLGIHLKDIKRIRRTSDELKEKNLEFTDKNKNKLLRKLRTLKNSFVRRQNDFFQQKQKKAELEN